MRELRQVRYLKQIVVGIDGGKARDWRRARKFFAQLPKATLLWNDGPRMQKLYAKLEEAELSPGLPGKGRNVWTCFGYVLASEQARMVAVHDCDILTYNRELLARLCYPVAHPSLGFDFCKGYYARVTDKLNGRVMRLLVTPLLRALKQHPRPASVPGLHGYVSLSARGRILAGCGPRRGACAFLTTGRWKSACSPKFFAIRRRGPFASRNCATTTITSTRNSPPRDADKGLNKMAVDITKSFFRRMAAEGIRLDAGLFDTLLITYMRQAEDTLRFYSADAAINGLHYPRHDEESAVTTFVRSIQIAAKAFQEDPLWTPLIAELEPRPIRAAEFFRRTERRGAVG